MASAFQGFAINLNLLENFADRDVINNLGGEPIADDIILFLNNLRNFSFLNVSAGIPPAGNINGSYIEFSTVTQKFVFTDKTKISVNNIDYYIGDSNGFNSFRLYTNEALTNLVTNPPVGIYKRSDAVSITDIKQLVPIRDKVLENIGLSQNILFNQNSTVVLDQNFYNSFVRVYYNISGLSYPSTLRSYFELIEKQLDSFEFVKQKSISSDEDFVSDEKLSLAGSFTINDPAGVNNTSINTVAGNTGSPPGIFILNTSDNTAKRIFSGNENVWTEPTVGNLGVTSNEIVVGNLVFEESPKILRKSSLPAIVTATTATEVNNDNSARSFTHYVSVMVNDEEYFLLLK